MYNNTIKVYDIIEKYSINKQSRFKRFLFTVHKIIKNTLKNDFRAIKMNFRIIDMVCIFFLNKVYGLNML